MCTLLILIELFFGLSVYKIYKSSGSWSKFDPFDVDNFLYYLGFLVGGIVTLILIFTIFIVYLP